MNSVTWIFWITVITSNALLLGLVSRAILQNRKLERERKAAELKDAFESRKECL